MSLWLLIREMDDPQKPGGKAHEAIQWVFQSEDAARKVLEDPDNEKMRSEGFAVWDMAKSPFAAQLPELHDLPKMTRAELIRWAENQWYANRQLQITIDGNEKRWRLAFDERDEASRACREVHRVLLEVRHELDNERARRLPLAPDGDYY